MKSWERITLVVFILIGSATFFGYWSVNQFNQVFDNLSASYLANTSSVYPSFKQNAGLAFISPEISVELATSTDTELSFTFPQKDTGVYISCTYPIAWRSSTTIHSLYATLVDSDTGKSMGPVASGLAKENTIEKEPQNLNWKVGFVLPGAYYIKISKINNVDIEAESEIFIINKISENIDISEQKNICEESGGLF